MLQESWLFLPAQHDTYILGWWSCFQNGSGVLRRDLQPLRWISKDCECDRKAIQAEDRANVAAASEGLDCKDINEHESEQDSDNNNI